VILFRKTKVAAGRRSICDI